MISILIFMFLALASVLQAGATGVILSHYTRNGFLLTADPEAKPWKGVPGVFADRGAKGELLAPYRTEIRSRWTDRDLYLLFICPYKQLHLKPSPTQTAETNQLWDWDVAELFIGSDFKNIRRYKEFEMSPQGEWVDLDIDLDTPHPEAGWLWNSGFQVKARIDPVRKVWYGEMRIPFEKIDTRRPRPGLEMRANLYRCQGAGADRKYIAWQPTHSDSFHVPESFGRLKLAAR